MAQVASCAEKHVDLPGVPSSEGMTIVDDDDSPSSAKKLKQARLPFKPIGPKSQICVNPAPHGVPKKRKLSDQESPSAKAPKIFNKHQADRLKHDIPEKTPSDIGDHDNEVSSSSEAENVPVLGMAKRKPCETNILERFIRKSSQEEISSTNEVVDLTEISEDIIDNCDNAKALLEVTSSKGTKKAGDKLTGTSDEKAQPVVDEKGAEVQPEDVNNVLAIIDEDEAKKDSITGPECKDEGNKTEITTVAEPEPIKCVDVDMVEEEDLPISHEKEQVTQVDTARLNDLDASAISVQSDENKSSELNGSSSSKTDSDEESSTSSDESDDEDDDEDVDDTSLNETQNSGGDVSMNDSLADKSVSSQDKSPTANSSTCKTPKTKPQKCSVSKTPGGSTVQTSTPKNLRERPASIKMSEIKKQEKKQDREAKRQKLREQKEQERQQQKEKKEQERLEAKKKKDEEKAEKERKKKEEKDKKERERQEKKDQLEREKQEKLQQKEEEKKKKQEIIDAKLEEKRKKDEEKQKEEDEKNKKKQKEKQTFTSFFFIKKAQSQTPSKVKEQSHFFMPFEVKKDMFLAPRTRRELQEEDKAALDQHLQTQESQPLYIKEITNSSYQKKQSSRTLPRLAVSPPVDVDDEDSVKCMDVIEEEEEKNKNLVRHHCKLLQFHTNYRPPYYGTWRKKSTVLNPRKPFKQDTELFDYEVDSDDEWEEEEPGESVSSSEDEGDEKEDKDEDEEEEEDGWMVPHGYLSEDEGCEQDEEITPDVLKARQMAKQEAWEAEQKRQKQPVRAVVIGVAWEGEAIASHLAAKLAQFQAVCLSMLPIDTRSRPGDNAGGGKDGDRTSFGKGNRKPVPEEAMPDLIRLLHGNLIGIKKLIKEFRLYWKKKTSGSLGEADGDNMDVDESVTDKNASVLEGSCTEEKNTQVSAVDVNSGGGGGGEEDNKDTSDGFGMSKRQLEMKIMSIALRERRPNFKKVCWYVKEEVLKQYEIEEPALPNAWQYVSKGLIKVKNEEAAGRKTPNNLAESFTDSVSIIMKEEPAVEEAEAKPLPKDQPSIMQFAKKMQPSELPKPKIRRVQLKPATPVPTPSAERSPVADFDTSAGEEVLGPYKTLPKDQRSIMDFAKKPPNGARTVPPSVVKKMLLSPKSSSSADLKTSPKQVLSRETTPKQKVSRETTPKQKVSRETTPKQILSRETTPKQTISKETTLKGEAVAKVSVKGVVPTPSATAVTSQDNDVAKKTVISASKEEAMDVDDCIIID